VIRASVSGGAISKTVKDILAIESQLKACDQRLAELLKNRLLFRCQPREFNPAASDTALTPTAAISALPYPEFEGASPGGAIVRIDAGVPSV